MLYLSFFSPIYISVIIRYARLVNEMMGGESENAAAERRQSESIAKEMEAEIAVAAAAAHDIADGKDNVPPAPECVSPSSRRLTRQSSVAVTVTEAVTANPTLGNILNTSSSNVEDLEIDRDVVEQFAAPIRGLRQAVIDGINELAEELDNLYTPIAKQAEHHIHANEVILTMGDSKTVNEFLKAAAKRRRFEVIVAETAPSYSGHSAAKVLAEAGISTTVITDSAVFAMMSRVNKVIIPTHAVMANGGLIGLAGTHAVAIAAKHHSVPMVVITGLYKLCPLYPNDIESCMPMNSPAAVLSYDEVDKYGTDGKGANAVDVINPGMDYVPPELVSLFITNFCVVPSMPAGGHQPSYMYRLLSEYYSSADYDLEMPVTWN